MQILGRLLERTGYRYFFYFMIPWAIVGAILMFSMVKQVNLRKGSGH
jgi:OPA family glycerol-3-phosphate transporter-like MFS transporter